jgi:hypothetical protein
LTAYAIAPTTITFFISTRTQKTLDGQEITFVWWIPNSLQKAEAESSAMIR